MDYTKAFVWITTNWKILKEMGISDHLPASWETCMQVKKQQLELDREQRTGSKLGKEYVKTICCHPIYLTSMQSTLCEMPGWMNHKLESRLPREISITSDMQMTPSYGRKQRGTKEPLDKGERGEWKSWLKTQCSKNKDHNIQSHHFMANRWAKKWKQWRILFSGVPKSLQMVTAAMKLKDTCSLEGKLWPT